MNNPTTDISPLMIFTEWVCDWGKAKLFLIEMWEYIVKNFIMITLNHYLFVIRIFYPSPKEFWEYLKTHKQLYSNVSS